MLVQRTDVSSLSTLCSELGGLPSTAAHQDGVLTATAVICMGIPMQRVTAPTIASAASPCVTGIYIHERNHICSNTAACTRVGAYTAG